MRKKKSAYEIVSIRADETRHDFRTGIQRHNLLLHFAALEEGGVMQFDDLNGGYDSISETICAPQIKRCDEMERSWDSSRRNSRSWT